MKKIISLLVILVICCALVITLVACGEDNAGNNTPHTCIDSNQDHKCDICDKDSACLSEDKNHFCDICGKKIGECTDDNLDHSCDVCAEKLSECKDIDGDWTCDICERRMIVSIRFYHTMGENMSSVLDKYIVEFNKLYPNITVHWEQVGNYDDVRQQISSEIPNGKQPNIAYCYPDHVALYNLDNAVVSLDNLINNSSMITRADGTKETIGLTQAQKDDFIEGYYAEGAQFGDGKMYSMPFSKSTEVLYYNKTFFDEHGLTPPTTWDEMEEVCRRIKEIDPDCFPLGYDSESNWFITMCEQLQSGYTSAEKGNHFLFDNQTNRDFVKRFRTWYEKGYLTTQELYGSYTSGLFTTIGESTAEKKVVKSYMSIGSSAGATHQRPAAKNGVYPFEVGITSVPQINPANPSVISQGPSVCIFNNDNPLEVIASWLFVKFLTTNADFQAEFSLASGFVPVLKSAADTSILRDYLDSAYLCEMVQDNKGNLVIDRNPDGTAKFILDENGNKQYLGNDYIAILCKEICLAQANAYFAIPAFYGCSTASYEVGFLMTECLFVRGDADAVIDKAFKDAIKDCENRTSNGK